MAKTGQTGMSMPRTVSMTSSILTIMAKGIANNMKGAENPPKQIQRIFRVCN